MQASFRRRIIESKCSMPVLGFGCTRRGRMRIRAPDESVLERVHSELVLHQQPGLQGVADIIAGPGAAGFFPRLARFE